MFIDARHIPGDTVIETDVCIAGAGAAGITIARELSHQPIKVCLLEGGGLEFDEQTQFLHQGEVIGLPLNPPDISRLRQFGGSTELWAGVCRPLDHGDFKARSWLPFSGWPISRTDLDPFYERAFKVVQLRSANFEATSWTRDMAEFFRLPFIGSRLMPAVFHKSPPTRFGKVYQPELQRSTNVAIYLYANVVDIETNEAASTVCRLQIACLTGNRFWLRAKIFILALGGIENPRLLLASNKVQSSGLGNAYDLVGRFFMNHPQLEAGWILLSKPSSIASPPISAAGVVATRLMLSDQTLEEDRLVKFSAYLQPSGKAGDGRIQNEGIKGLRRLVRGLRQGDLSWALLDDLGAVLGDLKGVTSDLVRRYSDRPIVSIFAEVEQVPNPDSRVTLGVECDELGLPRIEVDWRFTEMDKISLRRSLEIIGEEVGQAGFGRLKMDEWVASNDLSTYPGTEYHHHCGTTRMSDDPKIGVVDKNCRVHGVDNLYIAGSSVFPTIGVAPPTVTIVALALRLAEHVKERFGRRLDTRVSVHEDSRLGR